MSSNEGTGGNNWLTVVSLPPNLLPPGFKYGFCQRLPTSSMAGDRSKRRCFCNRIPRPAKSWSWMIIGLRIRLPLECVCRSPEFALRDVFHDK